MKADVSSSNYKERYLQYTDFERIIHNEYWIIGQEMANLISGRFENSRTLKVLDVGCGTGQMPNTLIKLLQPHEIELRIDYMDPVAEALSIYESNVPLRNLGNRIHSDFAEFDAEREYDVVLANNSLCGYDTSDKTNIERLTQSLLKGGVAIVTLPSDESDWVKFARKFWLEVHGKQFEKTVHQDITRSLDGAHIVYQERVVQAPAPLGEDFGRDLQTVFAVMMYVDREVIGVKYRRQFENFRDSILSRGREPILDFRYGITEVHHE